MRIGTPTRLLLAASLLGWLTPAHSQLESLLEDLKELPVVSSLGGAALSNDDIVGGLKEALAQGTRSAVKRLGREDGYFGDPKVKIPLPGRLSSVEKALRLVGQARYADEFVLSMNRAAERAVPEASAVFGSAIREMTLEDAKKILDGPDDAATQSFRRVGEVDLRERMMPIVSEATSALGATSAYKKLIDKAGPAAQLAGSSLNLDRYVTNVALNGLFKLIAAEEKRIRENPVARTTELMKKVFAN